MHSTLGSWIVFVLLGTLMGFLRYGDILDPSLMNMLQTYGPWAFIVIYVLIVLAAYKDTIFQGLLCTLIPFYPFYWLFVASDAFLMRAIVAALLVGIGQDSATFLQTHSSAIFREVNDFISSGGGDL